MQDALSRLFAACPPLLLLLIVLSSEGALHAQQRPGRSPRTGATVLDLSEGQRVFLDECASCHGEHGDGKSPGGPYMRPPAFDLTGFQLSHSLIYRVLQQGVPGSEMPSWPTLAARDAVVAYTIGLARRDELPEQARWAAPSQLQEAGRRVYVMHCTRCHGNEGDGKGPEADRYYPRPASFLEMRPSYAAGERVLRNGVPGTSMPAWPLLTDAEVQALTYYIRSLYSEIDSTSSSMPSHKKSTTNSRSSPNRLKEEQSK